MAQTIKLRRSSTSGAVPTTSSLSLGEVAINTYDGKMYIKKNDGSDSIVELSGDKLPLSGGTLTGNLSLGDNVKAQFGAGNDLEIYSDGTNGFINENGSGHLYIQATNLRFKSRAGENFMALNENGAVTAYYDNVVKLATTSTGIDVTGTVTANSGGGSASLGSHLDLGDNQKARFGAGDDLQIYHNGSESYIRDVGTGTLYIDTNGARISLISDGSYSNGKMADFVKDGAVILYHDNSEKLQTTSTGIDVTGNVTSTTGFTTGANTRVQSSSGMLFLNGPSALTFEVGAGSEKMRLTSTGLGIGTSSPSAPLSLIKTSLTTTGTGEGGLRVHRPNSADQYGYFDYGYNGGGVNIGSLYTGGGAASFGTFTFRQHSSTTSQVPMFIDNVGTVLVNGAHNNGGNANFAVDGGANLSFYDNQVQIGNSSINWNLKISHDMSSTATMQAWNSNIVIGGSGTNTGSATARDIIFSPQTSGTAVSTERMRIKGDGNVGIGTTTPDGQLHVKGPKNKTLKLDPTFSAGTWTTLAFARNGTDKWRVFHPSDDSYLSFYNDQASAHQFSLAANGNVGIGTTSPTYKLHVQSPDANDDVAYIHHDNPAQSSGTLLKVRTDAGDSNGYTLLDVQTNSGSALFVRGDRKVGIGTSSPGHKLHVVGANNTTPFSIDVGAHASYNFAANSTSTYTTTFNMDAEGLTIGHDSSYRELALQTAGTNRLVIAPAGAITFNQAFTFPTADGSANQLLQTDGSGNMSWATVAGVGNANIISDADNDTKIQVEESADEDKIRFDAAGVERFRIGSDIEVIAATDFNITGSNRRLNFTNGTGTVRTTGASNLNFGTNSTDRMTITSAGNVGIGTTAPNAKLELNVATGDGLLIKSADVSTIKMKGSGGVTDWGFAATNLAAGDFGIYASNSAGGDPITAGTAKLYFKSNGNVGIGTTSPVQKFQVDGNIYSNGGEIYVNTNKGITAVGNLIFKANDGTNYFEGMRLHSAGGLSIGTTTAAGAGGLLVDNDIKTNSRFGVGSAGNTSTPAFYHVSDADTGVYFPAANNIALVAGGVEAFKATSTRYIEAIGASQVRLSLGSTGTAGTNTANWIRGTGNLLGFNSAGGGFHWEIGGTQRMIMDSAGKVGIGTSSPAAQLDVVGQINLRSTTGYYIYSTDGANFRAALHDNGSYTSLYADGNGSTPHIVMNDNNVGIGTTNPSFKLDVAGTARFTADVYAENHIYTQRIRHNGDVDNYIGFGTDIQSFVTGNSTRAQFSNTLVRFNQEGLNQDFQVFGQNDDNLFYADASTDRIGIGTSSPAAKLEVAGGSTGLIISNLGDASAYDRVELQYSGYNSGTPVFKFRPTQTPGSGTVNSYFRFMNSNGTSTSANNYANVTIDGNVGIGTSSPAASLHIGGAGHLLFERGGEVRSKDTGGNVRTIARVNSSNELEYGWSANAPVKFMGGGSYTERMRIHTNGNVGIGHSLPDTELHVVGSGNSAQMPLIVGNEDHTDNSTSTTVSMGFGLSRDSGTVKNNAGLITVGKELAWTNADVNIDSYMSFSTYLNNASGEKVRITSAGKVGIGTTNPANLLTLKSGTNCDMEFGSESGGNFIQTYNRTSSAYGYLRFITNSETMRLTNAGNVGIGTTSPTNTDYGSLIPKLHVKQSNTTGAFNLVARFEAGGDANETGGAILINHSNDRGMLIEGGRDGSGSVADDDGVGHLGILNSGGAHTRMITLRQNMVGASNVYNVGIGTTDPQAQLQIKQLGINVNQSSVSSTSQYTCDSMSATIFRSARYTIQITNVTDSTYHLTEMLLIHDGTTPSISEFGTIFTGSAAEAVFTADISSGNVRLLATPASTDNMQFKVVRHSILV